MADSPSKKSESFTTTRALIHRIQNGDELAKNQLVAACLPHLRQWASGRLSPMARGPIDTDDLVQNTLSRAIQGLDNFQPAFPGAFLVFLRKSLNNQIIDEVRKANRRPRGDTLDPSLEGREPSPLDKAIGNEVLEAYELALARLSEKRQDVVILRVEFGYSHQQVADELELSSADAARMLATRAILELAEEMKRHGGSSRH